MARQRQIFGYWLVSGGGNVGVIRSWGPASGRSSSATYLGGTYAQIVAALKRVTFSTPGATPSVGEWDVDAVAQQAVQRGVVWNPGLGIKSDNDLTLAIVSAATFGEGGAIARAVRTVTEAAGLSFGMDSSAGSSTVADAPTVDGQGNSDLTHAEDDDQDDPPRKSGKKPETDDPTDGSDPDEPNLTTGAGPSALEILQKLFAWLSTPGFWLRILKYVAGAVLIFFGLKELVAPNASVASVIRR